MVMWLPMFLDEAGQTCEKSFTKYSSKCVCVPVFVCIGGAAKNLHFPAGFQ